MPTTPIIRASEAKSAQRATSSRHVTPDAPTASVGGGGVTPTPKVKTPVPTCPSAETTRQRTVYAWPFTAPRIGARMTVFRSVCVTGPESLRPSGAYTTIASGGGLDGLVEPQRDLRRRRVHLALLCGVRLFHRRVGRRGRGHDEREESGGEDGTPSHGLPPASSERCPKIDATSRSENSITATATKVSANPYAHSARRGRSAAPSGNTEATTSVQPIRWWRNAERANSQPFCSCTRNEAPEMKSAPAVTSDQYCEWSLPRTRASSTAPAAVAACAQIECATRCSVEKVEKTTMSHSQTPAKSASDGQR